MFCKVPIGDIVPDKLQARVWRIKTFGSLLDLPAISSATTVNGMKVNSATSWVINQANNAGKNTRIRTKARTVFIFLNNNQRNSFNLLICGKSLVTCRANTSSSDWTVIVCRSWINNACVGVTAKRAFHIRYSFIGTNTIYRLIDYIFDYILFVNLCQ